MDILNALALIPFDTVKTLLLAVLVGMVGWHLYKNKSSSILLCPFKFVEDMVTNKEGRVDHTIVLNVLGGCIIGSLILRTQSTSIELIAVYLAYCAGTVAFRDWMKGKKPSIPEEEETETPVETKK